MKNEEKIETNRRKYNRRKYISDVWTVAAILVIPFICSFVSIGFLFYLIIFGGGVWSALLTACLLGNEIAILLTIFFLPLYRDKK